MSAQPHDMFHRCRTCSAEAGHEVLVEDWKFTPSSLSNRQCAKHFAEAQRQRRYARQRKKAMPIPLLRPDKRFTGQPGKALAIVHIENDFGDDE
jgi:hypothetical protein